MTLRASVAVLAIVLLAGSTVAQPVCIVTSVVDEAKTALNLLGSVSSPASATIQPGGSVPATGAIYVILPTGVLCERMQP